MDINPVHRQMQIANQPIEQLANNKSLSEAEKIGEISRQFESILVKQILEAGQKTTLAGATEKSSTASIYQDMINNQLADSISRSGTLGFANSLKAQLIRQTQGAAAPGAAADHTPTLTPQNS